MSVSYGGDSITFADGSVNSSGFIGHRNRIINGAMMVDQRNAGAAVSVTNSSGSFYNLDRWNLFIGTTSAVCSVQQVSDAPVGFTNSLKMSVTTADSSVDTNDRARLTQRIEGFNFYDFHFGKVTAKELTISFWIKSNITGTSSVVIYNSANSRHYLQNYTILSADTWEYKSFTIPGDTGGTWLTDSGVGLNVAFNLMAGSGHQGTTGSWITTSANYGTASQLNLFSSTSNYINITGVQLERGSTASSFEYRPYGTELALCQRYYWQSTSRANGFQFYEFSGAVVSATTARINFNLPTAMRTQPSVAVNPVYNTGSSWQINLTGIDNYALSQAPAILTNDGAASGGGNMFSISFTTASTMSSANYGRAVVPYSTTGTATNNFQFSAEL